MQRFREIISGMAIGAMMLTSGLAALAQSTPDAMQANPRDQLAAVTPGSENLPTGYTFVGETFLSVDQVAATGINAETLRSGGFVSQYVSIYENGDANERIRAYVSLWDDDQAATDGFAVLEDEDVTNPDDALQDSDASVGEEPRETTTGTYAAADGSTIGTVDITFRRGPMIVGIAHESLDGSAADAELASDLATRIDERAQAVLDGSDLPHVDMTLPGDVVSLEGEGNGLAQAGFLGPVEVESIYGVQGSLLSGIDSAWVETTLIGGKAESPSVTVGVSTFTNPDDAALVVQQAADLFPPLTGQEAVDGVSLDGADAVTAFRYGTGDGSADSYRLLVAANGTLTVIDVQRAAAEGGAEETAMAVATAELACQTGGTCEAPALPGSLTGQ